MQSEKKSKQSQQSEYRKIIRELAPFMNLGLQMIIPIAGGVLFGVWLDGKNDTSPLWTLILALFGIVVAFYTFFKTVSKKKK